MELNFDYADGQTPIDEDEKLGLKIKSISTMGELNEFEQQNIEEAVLWANGRSFSALQILSLEFIQSVHKRMFKHVWKWAGAFRVSDKNIGVPFYLIRQELLKLLDDCQYWIENDAYPPAEIAIRFKHKLVSIHLFPNGNGRHSRLMAEILLKALDPNQAFTWGRKTLRKGEDRAAYLKALKQADQGDIAPLLEFSRS
ncbi:MAG: mobile mystery protein B [Saprospiraceae bacterium]|jgi:Fic-DOC domain mobile mystery protein B|nr:mobile mystery protein B [Saprospiraceae bacterium]